MIERKRREGRNTHQEVFTALGRHMVHVPKKIKEPKSKFTLIRREAANAATKIVRTVCLNKMLLSKRISPCAIELNALAVNRS